MAKLVARWHPIAFPRMSRAQNNAGSIIVVDPDGSHASMLMGPLVNSNTVVWSPDGQRIIGYVTDPDRTFDSKAAIALFDPSSRAPTTTFPLNGLGNATTVVENLRALA